MNGTDVFSLLAANSGDGMDADENDAWQVADCNIGLTSCGGELMELGYGVRRANARLIAAAPELFAELRRWLPGATAMGWDTTKAEAALLKAMGA
jgi:hypothetical protein